MRPTRLSEASSVHGVQEPPQRIDKRHIAEIPEPAAAPGKREQGIGVQGTAQDAQRIRNAVRDVQNRALDRQTECLPAAAIRLIACTNTMDSRARRGLRRGTGS